MKKILFVVNTMGCGGAERALLELLGRMDWKEYEIFLYVLMGQGELIRELPSGQYKIRSDRRGTPEDGGNSSQSFPEKWRIPSEGRLYPEKSGRDGEKEKHSAG